MSRRRHRFRPPASPAYKSGQVLTFAESDAPPPSKLIELEPVGPSPLVLTFSASDDAYPPPSTTPVELKPVGPAPLVLEFKAEDEQVAPPEPEKSPPAQGEPTA